jgi:FkbM family methyltransferase
VKSTRTLALLGAAASWARRAGVGRALRVGVDTTDSLLLAAGRPPLAAKIGDLKFHGYLRHRGFLEYLARGMTDESYYRRLILGAAHSRTTFVDAGAHIGVYTLLMCGRVRRVLAFEPDPYNVAALRVNVTRGGCANVEIREEALADRTGRAPFRAFRSTFSGSLVPREVDEYQELETDISRLDDALDDADLASLVVKLDVEGAELLALAGMRKTILRAHRFVLFVEVNPEALAAGGTSAERLVENLLEAGMECAFIDEGQSILVPLRQAGPLRKGNLICRKLPCNKGDRVAEWFRESAWHG